MKKIFILSSLIAVTLATPSFATPTELDKKTVASKAYVDTKQDIIETGLVEFNDNPEFMLPAITTYDSTSGLVANKIGILDKETIADDEGDLALYGGSGSGYGSEMDNYVPTVRAVAYALQNIWNDIPNSWQALPWAVNNDNGATQTAAINAYNTTFGNGTNNWAGGGIDLINGQFLANSLALKQNKITTGLVEFEGDDATINVPSVVTTNAAGTDLTGNQIGFMTLSAFSPTATPFADFAVEDNGDYLIPSAALVSSEVNKLYNLKQDIIPKSGYYNRNGRFFAYGQNSSPHGWLNAEVKGTGLVTKTADNGEVGERKIFEATDVANYHADGLTQIQQDIQDISIPTVGAMMTAIANGANAALPTGTTGTVVTYNGTNQQTGVQQFTETAISGTAAYDANDQLTNGNNIANVSLVETEIATRQKKRTCAGYEPGHENEADYCWLWNFPDD